MPIERTHFNGHIERDLVDQERRGVIHLVGADVEMVEEIDDLLLGFELHQRGAVVLAEFAEGGAHVAEDFAVVGLGVEAGGAAAEELVFGEELLMHFQSGDQADGLIVELLDHCSPLLREDAGGKGLLPGLRRAENGVCAPAGRRGRGVQPPSRIGARSYNPVNCYR